MNIEKLEKDLRTLTNGILRMTTALGLVSMAADRLRLELEELKAAKSPRRVVAYDSSRVEVRFVPLSPKASRKGARAS